MAGTEPHSFTPREWLSFTDVEGDTWLFDATFLASPWSCIFGRGCRGVLETDAAELGHGCCSHGAHFADKADRTRVKAAAAELDATRWQLRGVARKAGGPIHRNDDGDWVTRVHDGACIFLNRPGFEAGPGCALHLAAVEEGGRPMDLKPEVCWQLPLRLVVTTDENGRTTRTLREWDRHDWGTGGLEFHWWCTESHEAFVGREPVYVAMRDEILELVGPEPYEWFVEQVTRRPLLRIVPHPSRKAPGRS